nr:hypothetical protein CFP56_05289 [Quercus suber]
MTLGGFKYQQRSLDPNDDGNQMPKGHLKPIPKKNQAAQMLLLVLLLYFAWRRETAENCIPTNNYHFPLSSLFKYTCLT